MKISAVELVGDIVDSVVDYARSTSADLVVVADQATFARPYWRRNVRQRSRAAPLGSVGVRSSLARRTARARGRLLLKKRNRTLKQSRASSVKSTVAKASSNVEGETLVRPGAIRRGHCENGRGSLART